MKSLLACASVVTLVLALSSSIAGHAQSAPPVLPCGRVTAFTAPTATTTGSIRLGTTTFTLAAGRSDSPPPVAVGSLLCLTGEFNAAGEFLFSITTLGDQVVCGAVSAFTPASTTSSGSITVIGARSVVIPVRPGTTFSQAQTTGSQCFKFDINAEGNAEVIGYAGPGSGGAAALAPQRLPSTSTDSRPAALAVATLFFIVAAGAAKSVLRRGIRDH